MSKAELISRQRLELLRQFSEKTGESPIDPAESIFTDEIVIFAMEFGLEIA